MHLATVRFHHGGRGKVGAGSGFAERANLLEGCSKTG